MTQEPPESPPPPEPGHLRPTSGASLAVWAVVGLVLGWLVHPLALRAGGTAPVVTWVQAMVPAFVAAVVGLVAWHTWRTLHVHRLPMEPHRAVNRLVLGRACALVGALVAGGYAGYAVSWLGDSAELADQRATRSAVAAVGGIGIIVASLLLERACRVRSDGEAT